MKVKFYDLSPQHKGLEKKFKYFFNKTLVKKDFILGDSVKIFEKNFAKFNKSKFAVGVSNGTDAIFLALKVLNIKKGDEVIVPAHTFIASIIPIIKCGAKPVFVDTDDDSFLPSINSIVKKINTKTKAIIVVHLYGESLNVKALKSELKLKNLQKIPILEDCSQAHGACNFEHKTGNLGDIGCFSLYPSKNLGGLGDAGIITVNRKSLYSKLLSLRNWGSRKKYIHSSIGYNNRMDTLQAGLLNIKLKELIKWNNQRIKLSSIYNDKLKEIKQIKLPNTSHNNSHVYHLYVIKTKERNSLQNYLKQNKVETIIHYPTPCHKHKAFKNFSFYNQKFPNTEKTCKEILSLPLYPGMEEKKINYIVNKISTFFKKQ